MLLKKRKRQRMNVRPPERVRSAAHMAWVRAFECCVAGRSGCRSRTEAHHAELEGEGTMGIKPGDDRCVPLCLEHHAEGHRIGWKAFEAKYVVDFRTIAAHLWNISPHGMKYRREHD